MDGSRWHVRFLPARARRCLPLAALFVAQAATPAPIHHDLRVTLDPAAHRLSAEATLSLPADLSGADGATIVFELHPDLAPEARTRGVTLRRIAAGAADGDGAPAPARYALALPPGTGAATIAWSGNLHHPVRRQPEDQARGVAATPGSISADGVFLGGASYWYPQPVQHRLSFSLEVELPAGWDAVSQGERTLHRRDGTSTRVRWEESSPQTEIFLVAGRWQEYARQFGDVTAYAFLREPDPALAERYLEATGRYLALFGELLGPYPYRKFALVENFWETGYGMPSFTLMGSAVIRLPFIVDTSYPHEILHNWWGNGVYVDYRLGNWAEGLTAYLADHLLQERRGAGAVMRRNHLQRYADYVDAEQDFPLIDFRARHSPATEAVGYGKAMMFFHMLRRRLGDEPFLAALRDFHQEHLFRSAGYEDLRRAFAARAGDGDDLRREFRQWTIRTGAPRLAASGVRTSALDNGRYELEITIEQTQPGPSYHLQVPLAVALEGRERALEVEVGIRDPRERIRLEVPARPLLVEVDPQFDLFRRVDRREIPPALSQVFGAERVTIVLPAAAPAALRESYRALAEAWRGTRADADYTIVTDREIDALPGDRALWLFGWDNRFTADLATALAALPVGIGAGRASVPGQILQRDRHSAVLVARQPADPDLAIAWLAADDPRAIPRLARRLPHYGRYGYLGFGDDESGAVVQGQWPVTDSPLSLPVENGDTAPPRIEYAPRAALGGDGE